MARTAHATKVRALLWILGAIGFLSTWTLACAVLIA